MTGKDRLQQLWRLAWVRAACLWLAYLGTAIFATWPLGLAPASAITFGFEGEATVPLLNVWTLWWNVDRFGAGFRGYWDAPIFYPTKGTFAFSEVQPTTIIMAPVVWLTGSRVLAYNCYQWLILSLNGFSSARLLRRLGYAPCLTIAGGLMSQMLPFIWWQLGVVQLTTLFGIVWTIQALLELFDPGNVDGRPATRVNLFDFPGLAWIRQRFVVKHRGWPQGPEQTCPETPASTSSRFDLLGAWWRGVKLGGAFGLTYLLCNYWGLYLAMLLVPASLWLWNARLLQWKHFLEFCISIGVALLATLFLAGPLIVTQRSLAAKHEWNREQTLIRNLSAHPRDYLDTPRTVVHPERPIEDPDAGLEAVTGESTAPASVSWSLYENLEWPEPARKDLWPLGGGSLKLILAPLGIVAALITSRRRRWGLFVTTLAAVAFGLSLGPTIWVSTWVPWIGGMSCYEMLQKYVPGFALIRSPFRFAMFFQIAIVWLDIEAIDLLNPTRWRRSDRGSSRLSAEPLGEQPVGAPLTAPTDGAPPADLSRIVHPAIVESDRKRSVVLSGLMTAIMICISLLLLSEVLPPRQGLFRFSTGPTPAWIQWLRDHSRPDEGVVCLPLPTGFHVHDYEEISIWMYWGTFHGRPLVNGYSGFFPTSFVNLKDAMARFSVFPGDTDPVPQLKFYPSDSPGLILLNQSGARFAVVKRSFATRDEVWQHPATKFRWAWVTADEQHQLDIYEIQSVE